MIGMSTLKAVVRNGRLTLDEPTDLPEGEVVELAPIDPFEHMPDEERERLHAALDESKKQLDAGKGLSPDAVLRELRSPR